MAPNLKELLKSVEKEVVGKSCLTENNRLSPFLNPPYECLHPGVDSDLLFKFHEIYPEVFMEETGFMGGRKEVYSEQEHLIWVQASKPVLIKEGYFDKKGNLRAPIAVYKTDYKGNQQDHLYKLYQQDYYVLFQQGSYQIIPESHGDQIKKGRLLVHRGLKDRSEFIVPAIEDEWREDYMKYLAINFLSPVISLKHNSVCKWASGHLTKIRIKEALGFPEMYWLEQPFTWFERIAKYKFGPNFVSYETPLDNIRLLSQWCGEGEVHILDPERAERVH